MDTHEIAQVFAPAANDVAPLHLRKGTIIAVAADGSITVTVGGRSEEVAGVRCWAGVCPRVGSAVWLAMFNRTLMALDCPSGPAFCSLTRTDAGTMGTGTWYDALSFANSTRIDTHGMWSAGAPTVMTCQVPGIYHLSGIVQFASSATGHRDVRFTAAGVETPAAVVPAASGILTGVSTDCYVALALGDTVSLGARHNAGVNLDTVANGVVLQALWCRPLP